LANHLLERASARSARAIGVVERVDVEDGSKSELGPRSVTPTRGLHAAISAGCRSFIAGAALGALPEEHLILLRELGLKPLELELQRYAILPLSDCQLLSELHDSRREASILGLEKQRRLAQYFGVLLVAEVDAHVDVLSSRGGADARDEAQ
jgi:hypothetical protein